MSTQPIDGEIVSETAIVPQVHLGSIAVRSPTDMVAKATEMADALANIINRQNLFKIISGRKYVMVEGWTTLGAMMGIVPVEEYCQPLPDGNGFEAKVKLIRASDGGTVGAASAECTRQENNWANRDSYAVRSMSITRATGKAYRLSFSWIMKLAGFEATPAEEMDGVQGSNGSVQAAQAVAAEKINAAPDTHKTVMVKELGDGNVSLYGDGLSVILVVLTEPAKNQLGMSWQGSPHGWVMPMRSSFALEDICKSQGVGFTYTASQPATTAPAPSTAQSTNGTPQLGHGKITNTELADGKKGQFMRVWQGGNKMQAFDNPQMGLADGTTIALFTLLKTAKGQDAIFRVNKAGNYLNIVGVAKLGRFTWDEAGRPL